MSEQSYVERIVESYQERRGRCKESYNMLVQLIPSCESKMSYLGVSCWSVYVCRERNSVPSSLSAGMMESYLVS